MTLRTIGVVLACLSLLVYGGCCSRVSLNVLVLGDSLTTGPFVTRSWPTVMQREMEKMCWDVHVETSAQNGFTLSKGIVLWERSTQQADVVLIVLGGNDYLQDVPERMSRKHLEGLVQSVKDAGLRTVIVGIALPQKNSAIFAEVAAAENVGYIPNILEDVRLPGDYLADGLHPNTGGHRKMGTYMAGNLSALLDRHL